MSTLPSHLTHLIPSRLRRAQSKYTACSGLSFRMGKLLGMLGCYLSFGFSPPVESVELR